MGHVTRELGTLTATLLAVRHQVSLAQAKLLEDYKRTPRDLPIIPGLLIGLNVMELLEKQVKLTEAAHQLTKVQRNTAFKVPPVTQACRRSGNHHMKTIASASIILCNLRAHRGMGWQRIPQVSDLLISNSQGIHTSTPPPHHHQKVAPINPEVLGPAAVCL